MLSELLRTAPPAGAQPLPAVPLSPAVAIQQQQQQRLPPAVAPPVIIDDLASVRPTTISSPASIEQVYDTLLKQLYFYSHVQSTKLINELLTTSPAPLIASNVPQSSLPSIQAETNVFHEDLLISRLEALHGKVDSLHQEVAALNKSVVEFKQKGASDKGLGIFKQRLKANLEQIKAELKAEEASIDTLGIEATGQQQLAESDKQNTTIKESKIAEQKPADKVPIQNTEQEQLKASLKEITEEIRAEERNVEALELRNKALLKGSGVESVKKEKHDNQLEKNTTLIDNTKDIKNSKERGDGTKKLEGEENVKEFDAKKRLGENEIPKIEPAIDEPKILEKGAEETKDKIDKKDESIPTKEKSQLEQSTEATTKATTSIVSETSAAGITEAGLETTSFATETTNFTTTLEISNKTTESEPPSLSTTIAGPSEGTTSGDGGKKYMCLHCQKQKNIMSNLSHNFVRGQDRECNVG